MNELYLRDKGRYTTDADIDAAVAEAHRMYRPKEFSPGREPRLMTNTNVILSSRILQEIRRKLVGKF